MDRMTGVQLVALGNDWGSQDEGHMITCEGLSEKSELEKEITFSTAYQKCIIKDAMKCLTQD